MVFDLIQVPVRFCATEGSPQAEGKAAGELVSGAGLVSLLEQANEIAWEDDARILFHAASAPGIPVIAAPELPDPRWKRGDVSVPSGVGTGDAVIVGGLCEEAWEQYPDQDGLIVVNARRLTDPGFITPQAVTTEPDASLLLGGARNDDLCRSPRQLSVTDVTGMSVVITDQDCYGSNVCGETVSGSARKDLAHELGHALMLGHGNGFDDNHDGLEPPEQGPRRYDKYCDPLGTKNDRPLEDALTPFVSCEESNSLMMQVPDCQPPVLRPLQVETARAVAKLVPGAVSG